MVTSTLATLTQLGADVDSNVVAALALHLAGVLDSGEGRSQVANISRELRACLVELSSTGTMDDELDRFLATLSTPVHPKDES
jgi:hypothetical protein